MRITEIKQQAKRQDRVSVYVDEKYSFSLTKNQALDTGLKVGQELSPSEISKLKDESSYGKLKDLTLRWLSLRPRSKHEIEQYLHRKTTDEEYQEKLISELEGYGYINDLAFAESWVRSRQALKPISQYRLKQELLSKRVPMELIDESINQLGHDDLAAVKEMITKKQGRYKDEQKLIAYLGRQGFKYDVIRRALDEGPD